MTKNTENSSKTSDNIKLEEQQKQQEQELKKQREILGNEANNSQQNQEENQDKAKASRMPLTEQPAPAPSAGMSTRNMIGNATVLGGAIASAAIIPFVGWIVALGILYSFKDKFKDDPKEQKEYEKLAKSYETKFQEQIKNMTEEQKKQIEAVENKFKDKSPQEIQNSVDNVKQILEREDLDNKQKNEEIKKQFGFELSDEQIKAFQKMQQTKEAIENNKNKEDGQAAKLDATQILQKQKNNIMEK